PGKRAGAPPSFNHGNLHAGGAWPGVSPDTRGFEINGCDGRTSTTRKGLRVALVFTPVDSLRWHARTVASPRPAGVRAPGRQCFGFLTENDRSIRLRFPCLSWTVTIRRPWGRVVRGFASFSSQTPRLVWRNRGARFWLAGVGSTAKSANTRKVLR